MANPDKNSTEAAMNAYMRQVEQFKENGGKWSSRELQGLRNQCGLSEKRAKLIEERVFTREAADRRREADRLGNQHRDEIYVVRPDGDSSADLTFE